jgi:hypothetical protein
MPWPLQNSTISVRVMKGCRSIWVSNVYHVKLCKVILRRNALDELRVAAARYRTTLACDAYQMC